MLGRIGTTELLVVLVIALLIFGPKQLPRLGKTFGRTIKGFKDGIDEEEDSENISNELKENV